MRIRRGMFMPKRNLMLIWFFALVFGVKDSKTKDVEEGVFPPGPFVLLMSSDGCPGGPEEGWHIGYINITTRIPFNQSETFLHSCGNQFMETSFNIGFNASTSNSIPNILRTFDDYTLQLNLCFKSGKHQNETELGWPRGIYGVYGTVERCPKGFTAHNLTSCLPPILRHNSDGYLPYYTVEEAQDSTVSHDTSAEIQLFLCPSQKHATFHVHLSLKEPCQFIHVNESSPVAYSTKGYTLRIPVTLPNIAVGDTSLVTFLYCRRSQAEEVISNDIQSFYPFFLIKDPKSVDCAVMQGFEVTDEVLPGLIYSVISDLDKPFALTYCYYVNMDFKDAILTYNYADIWEREGFDGIGTAFVDSKILIPSFEISLLGLVEEVESWVLIDVRETRMMSAILLQTFGLDKPAVLHNDTDARVTRIYVGHERWGFLHGGALRCRFSLFKTNKKWSWFVWSDQEIYSCFRSHYGRYLTMIFSSYKALGHRKIYNETCILVLTNKEEVKDIKNCNEELGMANFDIENSQLTASTWQASFPPTQARPSLSGWCAENIDRLPFMQVDLELITTVNGVILTNYYGVTETFVDNTKLMTFTLEGSYSFKLEFGTSLNDMKIYNQKAFIVDRSKNLEIPQTFLLSEPITAKYIRLYPTPFVNTSAPCMRFELLGCRKTEEKNVENYGTTIDQDWTIFFDVPYIPVYDPQIINSFGYPTTYAQNTFYKWNITLTDGPVFLQFLDISLRVYEASEFQNNMGCRDTIIVSGIDIINPLTYIKEYFIYVSEHIPTLLGLHKIRMLLNSDDNGRIVGVPQADDAGSPVYLGLLSCSNGKMTERGRGFRVYVVTLDLPVCWSPDEYICEESSMELISPRFLGMYDQLDGGYRYYLMFDSPHHDIIMIKITDFDISCHADSIFQILADPEDIQYCNKNVVYEEQFYMAVLSFQITYFKFTYTTCEVSVFPEGFTLIYKMIPDVISNQGFVEEDSRGVITRTVCSDEFQKCYTLAMQFLSVGNYSWMASANLCRESHKRLVTIKSRKEMNYIRQLMIDIYSKNYTMAESYVYEHNRIVESFIGLRRYVDSSGVHHEHWIDGTPLTFTAWDVNEPSDTRFKQCSKMWLTAGKLETQIKWHTIACDRKTELMLHICEQSIDSSEEKRTVQLADCFESSASHYKGNVSITRYGYVCQRWDSQLPNEHNFTDHADFPDETLADASNYCRSPDNDHTPWCFVMDSMIAWGYCEVKKCTSDEDIQPPKDPVTLFRCKSGEWMSHTVECNGIAECLDNSDEANCTIGDTTCKDDEFRCTDGRCIHVFQICDFNTDCNDASDEFCVFPACDRETEYRCDNGQCIAKENRCDSIKQCVDGSDETFCEECNADRAFQCDDKTCISKRLVCDLHTDCLDGADEESCTHIYTSCDDVWQDGLTEDGIYPIGDAGYRARCSLNRTSGFLFMEFLNNDWRRLGEGDLQIEIPDRSVLEGPNAHGYLCTQQFDEVPHRNVQRAKMIENSTIEAIEHFYTWNFGGNYYGPGNENFSVLTTSMMMRLKDGFENRIKIHNLKCKKGLGLWNTTSFCMKGQKSSKQNRWSQFGIDERFNLTSCQQEDGCGLNRWNENIYCSNGKSIESTKKCIYDLDANGITTGCRSLNHLQNCENVSCPAQHFKCPESYCVPLMYVCNGRIDCPEGEDETYCKCNSTDRKNVFIIVPSSDFIPLDRANILFETATRLGGTLFSKHSRVRVLKMSISPDPDENAYRFDSTDIESNSEHPNYIFERYVQNETDNSFPGTFQNESSVILWLSDTLDGSENYIFTTLESSNHSGHLLKYRVVIEPFAQKAVSINHQADVTELLIRDFNVLGTLGAATLFPDICTGLPVQCANRYRCSLSMVCIPHEQVCDGRPHCPYGDDEELCNFTCPDQCLCKPFIVSCANVHINSEEIEIPVSTRVLYASNTTSLGVDILTKPGRYRFPLLVTLNLSRCGIMNITKSSFESFINLLKLDISFNRFTKLPRDVFVNLHLLQELHLSGNKELTVIEPGAFNGLHIESLFIKYADLEMLYAETFAGLTLKVLDLSSNNIKRVEDLAFSSLTSQEINIKDNPLTDFSKRMFDGVTGVESLYTPAYKFCCVRPAYLNEEKCLPYKDEFSSCKHLMRNTTLQALMWTIGFLALIGNLLSIAYRLIYDKKRLKIGYGIFVTNLAISDLLMGVYMLITAVADKVFMDRYIEVDEYWRNSAWCKFAGVISTLSSEASVLFMCLITIDRVLVIKFPFGEYRLTTFFSVVAVLVAWALSFLIAVLPVLHENYFQNKFYSKSGVCLALPLTRDRPPGWLYSILIFVGFNLITFILIAGGQMLIYAEVRKQSLTKKRMNVTRSNDLKVARNLLLVVTTDFMCWFPIGLMGVLAMAGYVIPGEMYAWTAVLILPINSALNPFMYTFSAILSAKFSPSTQEQIHLEPSDGNAKVILDVLPYVILDKNYRSNRSYSLHTALQRKTFSVDEIAHIIHTLVSYLAILHDNGLVLDNNIDEKNIKLQVSHNLQITSKAKIEGFPTLSSNRTKRGDRGKDIHKIGLLTKRLLRAVKIK